MDREAEATAADLIAAAKKIFVLVGAGMSTESGIPDFRGPHGLWTTNPAAQRVFDIDAYLADERVRRVAWQMRRTSPIIEARPNAGHYALAALAETGRTVTIATQNIDGLQQMAGSPDVLELHGTYWRARCLECGDLHGIERVFARLDAGEEDPKCQLCGGILRTDTVAFGQPLDPLVLQAASEAAMECDLALAVGTSLAVFPAAGLCEVAIDRGTAFVIVNGEPTAYDEVATAVVSERIGSVLPRLVPHS